MKPYIEIENIEAGYLCKVKIDDVSILESRISTIGECNFEFIVKNVIRSTEDDELTKAIKVVMDSFRFKIRKELNM